MNMSNLEILRRCEKILFSMRELPIEHQIHIQTIKESMDDLICDIFEGLTQEERNSHDNQYPCLD